MNRTFATLAIVAALSGPSLADWPYPEAAKGTVVEDYHGTRVADPYRWLEEPDAPATRAWVDAENKLTFGYLHEGPIFEKLNLARTLV